MLTANLVRNCHTQCELSFISVIYLLLFSPSRQLQGKPDPMALGMMLHLMLMQCEEPPLPGSGWGSPGCRRLQTSLCSRYNGAQARAQSSPWRELRELVAYLSMTQAAKFCGWIGPSESRKTFKLSLIYLLKMLCNSAKRRLRLTPNMSNLTHPHLLQSLPVLCVWHAYSTDSTYTQQVFISSIWNTTIWDWVPRSFQFSVEGPGRNQRDALITVPNSSPCILGRECES